MFSAEPKIKSVSTVKLIPTEYITPNPSQPRRTFNSDSLMELSESIRKNGIMQPLTVRKLSENSFELIAGERRLRAARLAGLLSVPCIEQKIDPRHSAVLALLENLQREDLTVFEEAEGIARLLDEWGITQSEVAARLGKAQSSIANKLRLLQLNQLQRVLIINSGLTERHARALLKAPLEMRDKALSVIIDKRMNVSESERYIEGIINKCEQPRGRRLGLVQDVRLFVNTITKAVDTMRGQGLDAKSVKSETDDYIEYTIIIPKSQAQACRRIK